MIQIRRNGTVEVSGVERLRSDFAQQNCVLLPQLIEPSLLEQLRRQVAKARMVTKFEGDEDDQFGKVLFVPQTEPALFAFQLLMNNQKLFAAIESITQCLPIGNFFGRLHSSVPGGDHHIAWHGDNADYRLLGLTIELSSTDYDGGLFQLRRKDSEEILCEVPQKQAGDAFVFRISPDLTAPAHANRIRRTKNRGCRLVPIATRLRSVREELPSLSSGSGLAAVALETFRKSGTIREEN